MGTGSGQQSGTSSYKMSPQELRTVENQNKVYESGMPGMMEAQKAAFDASTLLLRGQKLPGYLEPLTYGIDEKAQKSLAERAVKDIQPFFGQAGLLDSGVNAQVSGRTTGDIYRASQEFNINTLMQLLNIGVGGQAAVTSGFVGVGSALAGLVKGTGTTSTQSSYSYKQPKAQTFQQIGSGVNQFASAGTSWMPGTR
jgi:hypothetical protein